MKTRSRWRPLLAGFAIALVLAVTLPVRAAMAGLVPTDRVLAQTFGDASPRERVEAFLEREDVKAELVALGVDPAEARARVQTLSQAELDAIAGKIDTLPAGEGFLVTFALVAGIIFLIFIITDMAGITNVFTFVK